MKARWCAPKAADALLTRALIIADGGDDAEAHSAFSRVVALHADDEAAEVLPIVCVALFRDAQLFMESDDLGSALSPLRTIIERAPGTSDRATRAIAIQARLWTGILLAELGRKEEAIEAYRRCRVELKADQRPEAASLYAYATFRHSGALVALDRYEDAVPLLTELLETPHAADTDVVEILRSAEQSLAFSRPGGSAQSSAARRSTTSSRRPTPRSDMTVSH